jgi:endonuclease-8
MPEGPSIAILRDEAARFVGKVIREADGTATVDMAKVTGRKIVAIRSFGKELLIDLGDGALRIHLLLFGSYRIDNPRDMKPRLRLRFAKGEIDFYACSVRYLEGQLDDLYDWRGDVLAESWNPRLARKKLLAHPEQAACDALLDQDVFAGVGNIIKNEVLFRVRVHPLSKIGALPTRKLGELVREARRYSFQFLEWKRAGVLKQHWLAHAQTICPRDHIEFHVAELGKRKRRAFYCERCQVRYE